MSLEAFQVLSAALFCLGLYGVLARRSAVLILMSIELMLNAVNINLIAAAAHLDPVGFTGQIIAIFVITVAAAEVGLALAIILRLFRNRSTVNVDEDFRVFVPDAARFRVQVYRKTFKELSPGQIDPVDTYADPKIN